MATPTRSIVLLGAGHTHAHVIRKWREEPIPGCRLTVVSDFPIATYSGMLPGTLAGLYPRGEMEIDLCRLSDAAGAELVIADTQGLDRDRRELRFADRPPLPFDVLSIGIGSVPSRDREATSDPAVVTIKPMQTFLDRLEGRLQAIGSRGGSGKILVAVVGGGAGGIEIAMALRPRVQMVLGERKCDITILEGGEEIGTGLPASAVRTIHDELAQQSIGVQTGRRVASVRSSRLHLEDGSALPVDLVLWATGAAPPPLLAAIPLPKDDRGFLRTNPMLQTTAGEPIFVVGDTGTIDTHPAPKAGVYAVRQAPILWQNLRRLLEGRTLLRYQPQRDFLKLMSTGDGRAILSYRGFTFRGRWCWWLKDWIDTRFVRQFQF